MKNVIYGKNPIREALNANQPVDKIFLAIGTKKALVFPLLKLAREKGIPVREVDRKKLIDLVGHENHQGIVAVLSSSDYGTVEDIFRIAAERNETPLIALLDEIQDPQNLGAIIRSAEALGIHGIILSKDRSAGLTTIVAKTSAGAIAHMLVARVTNLVRTIEELKEQGLWIVGADQDSSKSIDELDATLPLGIVIGSEGKGLRRLVREKCDFLVRIPMHGKINSLNASVAAAILFYEIRRRRKTVNSFY